MRTLRIRGVLLAAALLVSAAGCTDGLVDTNPPAMVGTWLMSHPGLAGGRTETRMTFAQDGAYSSEMRWVTGSGETMGHVRVRGHYRMEGDHLLLRITRSEEWQAGAAGPNPAVDRRLLPQWQEHGTVSVDGEFLTHTFVSAPFDAPETHFVIYHRKR